MIMVSANDRIYGICQYQPKLGTSTHGTARERTYRSHHERSGIRQWRDTAPLGHVATGNDVESVLPGVSFALRDFEGQRDFI